MSEINFSKRPLVSVCMVTYQHADFVGKAIESILSQVTNFRFELLIGEDCSSDGTRGICKQYAERYPDIIRLFLRRREDVIKINGRPTGRYNFCETLASAKGKYIALLEGDDYWVDDLKLQKQVEFLEKQPECSACIHQVNRVEQDGTTLGPFVEDPLPRFSTKDLLSKTRHHTSSLMLRNLPWLQSIPEWHKDVLLMDRLLAILISFTGPLGFIDQTMSHYRLHSGGIYTGEGGIRRLKDYLIMYERFYEYFVELDASSRQELRANCRTYQYRLIRSALRQCAWKELLFGLCHWKAWGLKV